MRELDVRSDRNFRNGAGNAAASLADEETSAPLQLGAILIGALAIAFIVANAAFMQSRPHPAPMFQTRTHGAISGVTAPVKSSDRIPAAAVPGDGAYQIETIQKQLLELGYDAGPPDGVFGTRTQNAIIAFERDRDYPEAGRVTPLLMKRLDRARRVTAAKAVGIPGMKPNSAAKNSIAASATDAAGSDKPEDRDDILLIQRALSDLGYGPLDVDGLLGNETAQAIQRFELDRGMPITGKMGDRIIAELVLIGGMNPIARR